MSSQRPSPAVAPRKPIALKRVDGEPLTRVDIQYDVLYNIFHDTNNVFTDPYPSGNMAASKICFRDLYLKTILHAPKATKALKDKMSDSSLFAEDFAMLALLVNVGRVNTTMSFFPEMKTAIRTYHPIPALQRTAGNLQDAPRIKHILKSSLLGGEQASAPSTPADILACAKAGRIPSTTIMNLVFVLSNHSASIGRDHLPENIDFIDLFLRGDVSSLSRARAFLWLCYHYLEAPSASNDDYDEDSPLNPFADHRRGNTPTFVFLSEAETAQENVDPEAEKILADKLVAQRAEKLKLQGTKENNKGLGKISTTGSVIGDDEDETVHNTDEVRPKGKRAPKKPSATSKGKKTAADKLRQHKEHETNLPLILPGSEDEYEHLSPQHGSDTIQNQYPQNRHQYRSQVPFEPPIAPPLLYRSVPHLAPEPSNTQHRHRHRYSPYGESPVISSSHSKHVQPKLHRQRQIPSAPLRSILQQAWHVVTTTDALVDSDEEIGDEQVRYDCIQRLRIVTGLRHKEPTPEPDRHPITMTHLCPTPEHEY